MGESRRLKQLEFAPIEPVECDEAVQGSQASWISRNIFQVPLLDHSQSPVRHHHFRIPKLQALTARGSTHLAPPFLPNSTELTHPAHKIMRASHTVTQDSYIRDKSKGCWEVDLSPLLLLQFTYFDSGK